MGVRPHLRSARDFPEQDEHFTTETARRYWHSVEAAGIAKADGIICSTRPSPSTSRTDTRRRRTSSIHDSVPYVEPGKLVGRTIRDIYAMAADWRVMLWVPPLIFLLVRRRRAPEWMQRTGTEWVYRLVTEPRRLGSRYTRSMVVSFGFSSSTTHRRAQRSGAVPVRTCLTLSACRGRAHQEFRHGGWY